MRLEHFGRAFDGSGLLLLYSGTPGEVEQLRATVQKLLVAGTSVSLHDLDFVQSVADCEMTASSEARGHGVRLLRVPRRFVWSLPPSDWEGVHDLLEPFCYLLPSGAVARFQYLHERGGTEVIYSTARQW